MREPRARPTTPKQPRQPETQPEPQAEAPRGPRAFAAPEISEPVADLLEDEIALVPDQVLQAPRRKSWAARLFLAGTGILVSFAIGLAIDGLIRGLFARFEWLGWAGLAAAALFVLALIALVVREMRAWLRLGNLEHMRQHAETVLVSDKPDEARQIVGQLQVMYASRPDLARMRTGLDEDIAAQFDGRDMLHAAERRLMTPLDARARALTAAASKRVALVTAISPRALVDLAFVAYESFKLARAIAELYGARPGFVGSWRLVGAVLSHLAITGGIALGDSVVQQLVGHGLAARLSARLGEGFVNGLMTVRVGIAAMRVTRPLPYAVHKPPMVMDFAGELAKVATGRKEAGAPDKV